MEDYVFSYAQFLKITFVLIYFVAMFAIGYIASRRVKDLKDYFVAGKKLGYWVVAFSARATGESAWLLLGLTGMGAVVGVQALWVVAGEVIGVSLAWLVLSLPFKNLTDDYDSVTVPDYLESRLRDASHLIRIIAAISLVVFPTIYVAAQLHATGQAFDYFLGFGFYTGILIGFAVVLIYIVVGGFVAVAWSDLIQGVLMFAGLVILPAVGIYFVGGMAGLWSGLGEITATLPNSQSLTHIMGNPDWGRPELFACLALLFIGLGYLGSPQIFVRFISLRSKKEINRGTWVAILWTLGADTGAVLTGLAGRVYFESMGGKAVQTLAANNWENILPLLSDQVFPLIISSMYVAIVLAAIMSTIDSLLILASSALVRDFYQKIFHPEISNKDMTSLCRTYTFVLSIIALAIAITVFYFNDQQTIFWFVIFGWSGIAATFCPVIILSLFWSRLSRAGTAAGMVTGFLGVIVFKFWPNWLAMAGYEPVGFFKDFIKLGELAPAFFSALVVAVLVSLFTAPPEKEGVEADLLRAREK